MDAGSKTVLLISVQEDLRPLGLRYVHYSLLGKGWHSILLFLPRARHSDALSGLLPHVRQFVSENRPIYVGFTVMSLEFQAVCTISTYLKEHFPSLPIVWGGTHPTIVPESCFPYADYVCLGEGEEIAAELAEAIREGSHPGQIAGLCRSRNGQIENGPFRPVIQDLNGFPLADAVPVNAFVQLKDGRIQALDEKLMRRMGGYRGKVYDVMASRGCPFSCAYCGNNALKKVLGSSEVRRRRVEDVLLELEHVVRTSSMVEFVNFQDDCFLSCPVKYLKDFCGEYKKRVNKPFVVRAIPTYVTAEKLSMLRDAGVAWLTMGLQTGSERVCREVYKRKSSVAKFIDAARMINEAGIAVYYDVILDNPFESDNEKLETAEAILRIPKPFYVHFYSLTFYPGTDLHERVRAELPELADEYYEKDYRKYKKVLINHIIRVSGFLPEFLVRTVIRSFRHNPNSLLTSSVIRGTKLVSGALFEPLTALRVVMLSEGNSLTRAVRRIPVYATDTLYKYVQQFVG